MLSEYRLDKYWTWLLWCCIHSPPVEPSSTPCSVFPYPSRAHPIATTTKEKPPITTISFWDKVKDNSKSCRQCFVHITGTLQTTTPQAFFTRCYSDRDVLRMCHLSHRFKQMAFHFATPPLSTLLNTRASMWRWQEGKGKRSSSSSVEPPQLNREGKNRHKSQF